MADNNFYLSDVGIGTQVPPEAKKQALYNALMVMGAQMMQRTPYKQSPLASIVQGIATGAGSYGNMLGGYQQQLLQDQLRQMKVRELESQIGLQEAQGRLMRAKAEAVLQPKPKTPADLLNEWKLKKGQEQEQEGKDFQGRAGYFAQFTPQEIESPELKPDIIGLQGTKGFEDLIKSVGPKERKAPTSRVNVISDTLEQKEEWNGEKWVPIGKPYARFKADKPEKAEKPEVKPSEAYNKSASLRRQIALLKNRGNMTDAMFAQLVQSNPDLAGLMRSSDQASIDAAINALEEAATYYESFIPSKKQKKESPKPSSLESFRNVVPEAKGATMSKSGRRIVPDPNSPSGYSYAD